MASGARISAAELKALKGNDSPIEKEGEDNPKGTAAGEAEKADAGAVSPEARHQMIAVAAYYVAERRGFCPGYEIEDWLAAQAEVDRLLVNRASH
jgi:Protein of unknown function (DUF2934)